MKSSDYLICKNLMYLSQFLKNAAKRHVLSGLVVVVVVVVVGALVFLFQLFWKMA